MNTAVFAGETDWRVPKREELVSIVDYFDTTLNPVTNVAFHGASCGVACTDITDPGCSCTSWGYWSASSLAPDPTGAWLAFFYNGLVNGDDKIDEYWVRAVRGGS